MNILRRFVLAICGIVLSLSLLGLAWSHVAAATILRRDTIKSWLDESSAYSLITDIALESASKSMAEQDGSTLPVDDPQVQAIAKDAFSPGFLKTNVEKVLDGTYAWLDGSADKPSFVVDINDAKQKLADGIGNYAISRAKALPACTTAQLQEMQANGFDVMTAACLPPGVDVDAAGAELRNKLLSSEEFLGQTTFTGDDVKVEQDGQQVTLDNAPDFKVMQTAYKIATMAPYLYGLAAILSALGIVFLSSRKRAGLKRVGVILISNGVFLGITYLIFNRGNSWLGQRVSNLAGDTNAAQELTAHLVQVIYQDISSLLLWYAIGFAALGAGMWLFAHFFRRTKVPKLKQSTDPEPPIDDSPKVDPAAKKPEPTETPKPVEARPTKEPPKIQL